MAVNAGLREALLRVLDISLRYEVLSNRTADHAEGVRAFREGRPPAFHRS